MINLESIVGDVIYISFRDVGRMKDIGIQQPSGHYMLKGYDQLGLWLEHPGIIIKQLEDKNGRPLPTKKQTQEEIAAVFIVHWENINSMMHYPNRAGFDFPDQFEKKIGFRNINTDNKIEE